MIRWPLANVASTRATEPSVSSAICSAFARGRDGERAGGREMRLDVAAQQRRSRVGRGRAGVGLVIGCERVRVDLEQRPVEQEGGLRAAQHGDRAVDGDARRDERVQERVRVPRARAVTGLEPAAQLEPQHRQRPAPLERPENTRRVVLAQ